MPHPHIYMVSAKKVDLKIVILGAMGAGKTSILHRYVHKKFFEDYQTTLGAHVMSKNLEVENITLRLQIWDMGGQDRFQPMVTSFYKGSDACILTFDVTDEESFECLDYWRKTFLESLRVPLDGFPVLLLGNKIDLKDRQVSKERALSWCEERKATYFEVSAKDDVNVEQAFEKLSMDAFERYLESLQSFMTDSFKLTPPSEDEPKPTSKCC
ncbi:ras-related protein Rab-7b [Ambystoma mexicanum]|uniref:ras-related protein Rab-7b n=1 Tax=Ambystoma mexicanum TaxID=8296 RepID=UPI0037E8B4B9